MGISKFTERGVKKVYTDTEMKEPARPGERTERGENQGEAGAVLQKHGSSEWQRGKR